MAEELERKAGYGLVIALSITAMIGTSLYFGPAIAASHAGNASLLAWVALALIGLYVGSCFAELSSLFPDAGGVYQFAKKAYGRFSSFLVGWVTWLVGSMMPALLIVAALDYLLPVQGALLKTGIAIGILLLLNYIAIRGVEASTAILIFFAAVTMIIILAIIGVGIFQIHPENYTPFFAPNASPIVIVIALFFIIEAFNGWESPTFMGGEVRNPQKIIPRSIMITSAVVAALMIIFPAIFLGIIPTNTLITLETPVTTIAQQLFGSLGADLIAIAIFLGLVGSAAGGIVSTPRLILALAKDKLFIEQLSQTHHRFKTPHKAIFFQTVVSLIVIIAASGDYESLLALLVPLTLLMYTSVIITIPILRKKYPDIHREVKAPLGKFLPLLMALVYAGVIVTWLITEPNSLQLFKKILSFIFFGIPIYILLNLYYNPDILNKTVNSLAPLNRLLEGFTLPRKARRDILNLFTDIKGKTVLEFGAGVGSLTMPLAETVGDQGTIYAVDLSKQNIKIINRRLERKGHKHIKAIHDEHFISRVHPDIPQVDMIFSVGNLSYIQDLRRVIRDMHQLLPENGRICLVEYVDYFWGIIPNQAWLDDHQKINELFKETGFSVRIRKRRGLFWNYLYIYGIKSDYDVPVI